MYLFLQTLILGIGVALLVGGATALVEGAVALARRARVSQIVIGMTVVSLGTSAPELAVNLSAAITSSAELVLGNVIGSNIFNTLAVIGGAALVRPLVIARRTTGLDLPFSVAVSAGLFALIYAGVPAMGAAEGLSRFDGVLLLGVGVLFGAYVVRGIKPRRASGSEEVSDALLIELSPRVKRVGIAPALLLLGVLMLVFGGRLIVTSAVAAAEYLGVSPRVIALSVVAIGTSLPELVTSLVAAGRGNTDVAVGNVIGSNVINIVLVLGVSVVAAPIAVTESVLFELVVNLAAPAAVLAFVYLGRGRRIVRSEGLVLVGAYLAYLFVVLRG